MVALMLPCFTYSGAWSMSVGLTIVTGAEQLGLQLELQPSCTNPGTFTDTTAAAAVAVLGFNNWILRTRAVQAEYVDPNAPKSNTSSPDAWVQLLGARSDWTEAAPESTVNDNLSEADKSAESALSVRDPRRPAMVMCWCAAVVPVAEHGQSSGTLKDNSIVTAFVAQGNAVDCVIDVCTIAGATTSSGVWPFVSAPGVAACPWTKAGHAPCASRWPALVQVISSNAALYVAPPSAAAAVAETKLESEEMDMFTATPGCEHLGFFRGMPKHTCALAAISPFSLTLSTPVEGFQSPGWNKSPPDPVSWPVMARCCVAIGPCSQFGPLRPASRIVL
mmetsp:Transcript_46369/g.68059  ORF Transcript_46369/g.68059 Transcript_46369/m.68059 type:complete len:334 (-) Transcript_46369:6283-7284(-)